MSLSNFSSSFHLQELSRRPFITSPTLAGMDLRMSSATIRILYGRAGNFGHRFHGLKLWIQKNLSTRLCDNRKHGQENNFKTSKFLDTNHSTDLSRKSLICKDQVQDKPDSTDETRSLFGGSSASTWSPRTILSDRSLNVMQTHSLGFAHKEDGVMPISIAIIGATECPNIWVFRRKIDR